MLDEGVSLLSVRWLFCACLRECDREQNLLSSPERVCIIYTALGGTPLSFRVRESDKKFFGGLQTTPAELKKNQNNRFTVLFIFCSEPIKILFCGRIGENFYFWFTDLSVAGLPAELKHIIQRRKRKQP